VDRDALIAWGRAVGAALRPPAVVALHGDLGVGKTTLAQAVCAGYGVTDDVTSPTFALVHEYAAPRGVVRHVDLYRLRDARELVALGWDELVAAADALVLVEWPERAGAALPAARVDIRLALAPGDPGGRVVTVQ
jgi:tRNA threonylcarbamoyladenosine biosynthesis protein TsaE